MVLYEGDNNDRAPSYLPLVMPYAKNEQIFDSILDPRQPTTGKLGWKPDPCGPPTDFPRTSYRVSFAYLRTEMPEDTGLNDDSDYYYWRKVPNAGMLASPWVGSVVQTLPEGSDLSENGPVMAGPISRINMDGSLFTLPKRTDESCLGGCTIDLFFNR
ncbi:hypothetical protein BH11ARM1_BH11ARM1_04830 [soil metagenome]